MAKLILSENAKKLLIDSVENLINGSGILDRIYINDENYIKIIHYSPAKDILLKETQKNYFYKNKKSIDKLK